MEQKSKSYLSTLFNGLEEVLDIERNIEDKIFEKARIITGETKEGKANFSNLYSIFDTIFKTSDNYQKDLENTFPIQPLSFTESFFTSTFKGNLELLMKTFRAEYERLIHANAGIYSFYHLLYQYGTRVAFSEQNTDAEKLYELKSDVSLFDRNRTLAGLHSCLNRSNTNSELPFLLVKGDLSGIQQFIYYNVSDNQKEAGGGKKVAKILRGRSFFITLFTEFIAEQTVQELDLTALNIVFNGGGNFILLLPNTEKSHEKLKELERSMNLFIKDKISSSLSLSFGVEVCSNTLFTKTSDYLTKVNKRLSKIKQRKHLNYLEEVLHPSSRKTKKTILGGEILLGETIPHSNYLIELEFGSKPEKDKKFIPLVSFEPWNKYYFGSKDKGVSDEKNYAIDLLEKYKNEIVSVKIISINKNENFLDWLDDLSHFEFPIDYGFKFLGKQAPSDKENGDLKDFSEIARNNHETPHEELSYPQLSAMRLDVDNLGFTFGNGFGEAATFQRIATLSREFHLFFTGYFNQIAELHDLYIVYSGGDDAFVVGSWYDIIRFAQRLHEDFQKFTCRNEDLHFSAGIFMCHPTYPVARFAKDAEKGENQAKGYHSKSDKEKNKNAIHVFDHTLSWQNFKNMMDFGDSLFDVTIKKDSFSSSEANGVLARSLVHRLLRMIKSARRRNRIDANRLNRNKALLHDLFGRHGYTDKELEHKKDAAISIIIRQFLKDYSCKTKFEDYTIPTSYVILRTRKSKV
jgi:CRISPR-associated protein Csm1